jgi:hypothetical protein
MSKHIPLIIKRMLERPDILVDEDRAEYCDLFELVCDEVKPRTLKEWNLAASIAYTEWEIFRLRGLKVRVVHAAVIGSLHKLVHIGIKVVDRKEPPEWHAVVRNIVIGVLAGNASAKVAMAMTLESASLTLESLVASTFAFTISTQVATDKLADAAYQRRKALYSDLERLRSKAAPNDRVAKVVESPSVAPSDGAGGAQAGMREEVGSDAADDKSSSADGGQS